MSTQPGAQARAEARRGKHRDPRDTNGACRLTRTLGKQNNNWRLCRKLLQAQAQVQSAGQPMAIGQQSRRDGGALPSPGVPSAAGAIQLTALSRSRRSAHSGGPNPSLPHCYRAPQHNLHRAPPRQCRGRSTLADTWELFHNKVRLCMLGQATCSSFSSSIALTSSAAVQHATASSSVILLALHDHLPP